MAFSLVSLFERCLVEVLYWELCSLCYGPIVLWRTQLPRNNMHLAWMELCAMFDTHVTLVLHEKCNLDRKV